ncbi:MAG TPA: pilus assembly protein PilM [Candidatus Paceibacterota bacterium]
MIPLLDTIKKSLGSLLPQERPSKVLGIDIGTSSLKIVELTNAFGKLSLSTYGEVVLGPYDSKEAWEVVTPTSDMIDKALGDIMREAQATAPVAGIGISSVSSFIFILNLPNVPEEMLGPAVVNEVRKFLPIDPSQISLDWYELPKLSFQNVDTKEVLVAAIKNDILSTMKVGIPSTLFTQSFYEIETFSILRSAYKRELSTTALIDCGASATRVACTQFGILRTIQTIKRGGYQLTEALRVELGNVNFKDAEIHKKKNASPANSQAVKTYCDALISEIMGVINKYEQTEKSTVSRIILSGGASRLQGFKEMIEAKSKKEVVFINPFEKVETPSMLHDPLYQSGPEFGQAAGLALKLFS